MNKKFLYNVLMLCGIVLGATSCEDSFYTESEPQFEVSLEKQTVRVGERAVFNFEGTADIISVYTGENGNSYEYADKSRVLPATMYMSFMFTTSSGTAGHPNPARVPLYYSRDFSGNYTLEEVKAATWEEVTDSFKMPTDVGQQISSGSVCINDYFDEMGKIYLAFFYEVKAHNESIGNYGRTQWNLGNFSIVGKAGNDEGQLYDASTAGWQFVYEEGGFFDETSPTPEANLPNINATRVLFCSEYRPTVDKGVWCVSGPIEKQDDVNLGFDKPVAVKAYADPTMKSYYHIYDTPGEYTATFIGVNASAYGRYEVLRQATVKVVNDGGSIGQPTPDEWQ